jgi:mono/diheme cytochrome c family protein
MMAAVLIAAPISLWAAEDGAALFKSKCAMCHGDNGEGKSAMQMPAVKGTAMTAEQIVTYLTKGDATRKTHKNPMGGLNNEQAKAVAEFVKGLK